MRFLPLAALLTRALAFVAPSHPRSKEDALWHMLAPLNSTVSLFCKPIFENQSSKAWWFKNDRKLGTVRPDQNLRISGRRSRNQDDNIPDVGFLVVEQVKKSDEGLYWCADENGRTGQVTALRVAYLEHRFVAKPGWAVATLDKAVTLKCAPPVGHPPPSVFWLKNSDKLPSDGRIKVLPNGDLRIESFLPRDAAQYTCVARNIAGRRTASGYIVSDGLFKTNPRQPAINMASYRSLVRWGHALWFVAGVVTTGAVILLYILVAFCCLRPRRRSIRPVSYTQLNLAPGFRKRSHIAQERHLP